MHALSVLMSGFNEFAKKIFVSCLMLCLGVISAFPKDNDIVVPPGNWGVVEHLPQGTKISVRMTFGDRIDGRFLSLDVENIHLTSDGKDRIYPRRDVAKIWQLRVPDKKLNGILIGMGAGAAGGIAAMVAFAHAKTNGPVYWDEEGAGYLVGAALIGIGIGAVAGAVVDASIKGDRLLYRK